MTDDDIDELDMAHRARLRAVLEADQLRAEVASLTNLLRLAEASVSLLRADLATTTDERAAARLELRRLRAAETPGTDDEALEAMGWRWDGPERTWVHSSHGFITRQNYHVRPWLIENDPSIECPRLALDAMRAAVPGSV